MRLKKHSHFESFAMKLNIIVVITLALVATASADPAFTIKIPEEILENFTQLGKDGQQYIKDLQKLFKSFVGGIGNILSGILTGGRRVVKDTPGGNANPASTGNTNAKPDNTVNPAPVTGNNNANPAPTGNTNANAAPAGNNNNTPTNAANNGNNSS